MSTDGTVLATYLVPFQSNPLGITVGPDGALWFTEFDAGSIGRITTGGGITYYPLLNSNDKPAEITSGPDGGIWFTETFGNKIGRQSTSRCGSQPDSPMAIGTLHLLRTERGVLCIIIR